MRKKLFQLSLIAIIALFSLGLTSSNNPAPAQADGTARVLVEFSPGKKGAVANALANAGGSTHYEFDSLNVIAVSLPQSALDGISRNPNVKSIEVDAERHLYGMGNSAQQFAVAFAAGPQTVPYGVDKVQARDVWSVTTGAGSKVCIIDSGFYQPHEDLSGIVAAGYSQIPGEDWNEDGNSHGTHVAGTIAGQDNGVGVVGVAPGVELYIVKIFNNDGVWVTNSSDLIDASNRCKAEGANVISMSLGGSRSVRAEDRHFASLYNNDNVLSIAAAGNDGNTRRSYPASYASVVSVAATDSNDVVAGFSQQNSAVEIAAPGVGVLSTTSYNSDNSVTVNDTKYPAGHIEFAATGTASGALVDGGLCDSAGSWSGKVVLCERGSISFLDKVTNVANGDGSAALIYNNEPGGFAGTLGAGNSSTIVALSLSQEDGQTLVAFPLVGSNADVSAVYEAPASGYEYYDGTSMATPHVSAVAALIWSANTSWTNQQVRDAMNATALDLGAAGLDNAYGYGLVQANDALLYLNGGDPPTPTPTPTPTATPTETPEEPPTGDTMHVSDITMDHSVKGKRNDILTTVTIHNSAGAAVPNATVFITITLPDGPTATGSAATNGDGQVTFSLKSNQTGVYAASVTNVTHASYTYNPSGNAVTSATLNVP